MTIENLEAFISSLPDWAMLDGCFPRSIRPTDVGGMVEIDGEALFLEKKGWGVPIKNGQARAYRALANQGNTVVVFWAEGNSVIELAVFTRDTQARVITTGLDGLRQVCHTWASGGRREQ